MKQNIQEEEQPKEGQETEENKNGLEVSSDEEDSEQADDEGAREVRQSSPITFRYHTNTHVIQCFTNENLFSLCQ